MADARVCGYCGEPIADDVTPIELGRDVFHPVPCALLYELSLLGSRVDQLERTVKGAAPGEAALTAEQFAKRVHPALDALFVGYVPVAGTSPVDVVARREQFLLSLFAALRGPTPSPAPTSA